MTGSEQVRRVKEFVHFDPASDEYLRVVSLSDLQRETAALDCGPAHPIYAVGYRRALADVAALLDIDLEEGKD